MIVLIIFTWNSQCLEVVDDVSPKLLSWKFQQKKYALAVLFRDLKPGFWCWSKWKVLRKFWFASDFNRLWVIFISELLIQGILWRLGGNSSMYFCCFFGCFTTIHPGLRNAWSFEKKVQIYKLGEKRLPNKQYCMLIASLSELFWCHFDFYIGHLYF